MAKETTTKGVSTLRRLLGVPERKGLSYIRWLLSLAGAVGFLAGYVIAVVAGIWWPTNGALIALLVILGLVVGFINITGREIVPYLIAAIALVLVGGLKIFGPLNLVVGGLGDRVNDIVMMLAIFTAPAAVVQAIRAGMALARPGDRE